MRQKDANRIPVACHTFLVSHDPSIRTLVLTIYCKCNGMVTSEVGLGMLRMRPTLRYLSFGDDFALSGCFLFIFGGWVAGPSTNTS